MSKSPLVSPPCGATPVPSRPTYLPHLVESPEGFCVATLQQPCHFLHTPFALVLSTLPGPYPNHENSYPGQPLLSMPTWTECRMHVGFIIVHTGVVFYCDIEPTTEFVPPTPSTQGSRYGAQILLIPLYYATVISFDHYLGIPIPTLECVYAAH